MNKVCVSNVCINKKELQKRLQQYISNIDLMKYFGEDFQKNILTYSELSNYSNIEQLLPHDESFIILLIEWGENIGHWVLLSRYICSEKNVIEYFNSYGDKPSLEVIEMEPELREQLNQTTLHLNKLLNEALKRYDVIYNKIKFQSENPLISTCGRHTILRAVMMRDFDLDLYEFIDFMKGMKKETKLSYDEIVAIFIK